MSQFMINLENTFDCIHFIFSFIPYSLPSPVYQMYGSSTHTHCKYLHWGDYRSLEGRINSWKTWHNQTKCMRFTFLGTRLWFWCDWCLAQSRVRCVHSAVEWGFGVDGIDITICNPKRKEKFPKNVIFTNFIIVFHANGVRNCMQLINQQLLTTHDMIFGCMNVRVLSEREYDTAISLLVGQLIFVLDTLL